MITNRCYSRFFILILLLAFGLRLFRLDAQSLWYDEGVTATVAQYDAIRLIRWTAADIQPPLYYLVVSGWGRLADWSEWSLRFPSAFFGTLLVPLLAALCWRLNRNRLAALTTALITAVHPLLLYHSQEARMYTLLVTLGAGAAYCVVRGAYCIEGRRCWRDWAGYATLAILAVYTHYFAIFLLLALMLAYLFIRQSPDLPISQSPNRFLPPILANALIFLAFLPWLGILFTRLHVDASYWEGALKLGEALRAVAIRFSVGETVLESEAVRWLWLYGAVTLICLAALMWPTQTADRRTHHSQFAILYLILPVAAVLTLASVTPKFNPRYVMIALPGLILLWSTGLARIADGRWWTADEGRRTKDVSRITHYTLLILLLTGFTRADLNWFTDAAFTKDQWREAAAYVSAHRQPDEAVILASGHAWPIWDYYAPDVDAIRLPPIEILDVNAVLTFANTGQTLHDTLTGKSGAWLIGWQDDVVDPMQITQLQLARAGEEQTINAQFWGLELHHFTELDAAKISPEPPIQYSVHANFGNQVELLGYSVEPNGDLLLFWKQRLTADVIHHSPFTIHHLPFDLHLTGETLTTDGLPYATIADRRLSAYNYPTFRWPAGTTAVGRLPAADWAGDGAAPGNYTLRLGVYDPAGDLAGLDLVGTDGQALGKRAALNLTLPMPTAAVIGENPFSWAELAPDVFAEINVDPRTGETGQPLLLNVHWWAESLANHTLSLAWTQGDQTIAYEQIAVAPNFPPITWDGPQPMYTRHRLRVPKELAPGDYELRLSLGETRQDSIRIPMTVTAGQRNFTPPPLRHAIDVHFGGEIVLLGSTTGLPSTAAANSTLELSLVWQAESIPAADYTVTVQWLDVTGRPLTQIDAPLPGGSANWLAGEVMTQTVTLPTPDQPGTYTLIAALYNANDAAFPRLRLADGADFVSLGSVIIR